MRRLQRPTRRQAGAAAALGLTGLSAYAAARYAPGSPTSVLVDRVGKELLRFHHESTQHNLEARLKPFVS